MLSTKNKVGRPAKMTKGRPVKVYLSENAIARAKKIGEGNLSEGIRLALGIREK